MGKRIVTGSISIPDVGRVSWTAIENTYANGSVYATVLQEARGPHGVLTENQRQMLLRLDHRLTA